MTSKNSSAKPASSLPPTVRLWFAFHLRSLRSNNFGTSSSSIQPGIDNLLIAIPQDIGEIRAAASELAALRWVWDNTPESA